MLKILIENQLKFQNWNEEVLFDTSWRIIPKPWICISRMYKGTRWEYKKYYPMVYKGVINNLYILKNQDILSFFSTFKKLINKIFIIHLIRNKSFSLLKNDCFVLIMIKKSFFLIFDDR